MTQSDWIKVLTALIGIVGILVGLIGGWIAKSFERLVQSIDQLNVNVAVIVEKVNSHERRIEYLERGK